MAEGQGDGPEIESKQPVKKTGILSRVASTAIGFLEGKRRGAISNEELPGNQLRRTVDTLGEKADELGEKTTRTVASAGAAAVMTAGMIGPVVANNTEVSHKAGEVAAQVGEFNSKLGTKVEKAVAGTIDTKVEQAVTDINNSIKQKEAEAQKTNQNPSLAAKRTQP